MDGDEEYNSDSTVLLEDYNDKPEKIDIKRRRLSSYRDKGNQSDQYEDENRAPDDVSETRRAEHACEKQKNSVDRGWYVNRCLASVNNNISINNDKEHNIINLDSDDEGNVDKMNQDVNTHGKSTHNEHILNSTPRARKPASINTRRATADVIAQDKNIMNSGDSQRVDVNMIPKITILKPSAINERRSTTHSDENNLNGNNVCSRMITIPQNMTSETESRKIEENTKPKLRILKPSAINERRATTHFEWYHLNYDSSVSRKSTTPQDMSSETEQNADRVKITSSSLTNLQSNNAKPSNNPSDNNNIISLGVAAHDVHTAIYPVLALKIDENKNESTCNNSVGNNKTIVSDASKRRGHNNDAETNSKRPKKNKKTKDRSPMQYNKVKSESKDKHKASEKLGCKKIDVHGKNEMQLAPTIQFKHKNPVHSTKNKPQKNEKQKVKDNGHDGNKVIDINATRSSNEQKAPTTQAFNRVSENRVAVESDNKLETIESRQSTHNDCRDEKGISEIANKQVLHTLQHKQISHEVKQQTSKITSVEDTTKEPDKLADTKIQPEQITNEVKDVTIKVKSNQSATNVVNNLEVSKIQDKQGSSEVLNYQELHATKAVNELETRKHHDEPASEIDARPENYQTCGAIEKREPSKLQNDRITSKLYANIETNKVSGNQTTFDDNIESKKKLSTEKTHETSDKTTALDNVQEMENEYTGQMNILGRDEYNDHLLEIQVGFFTLVYDYLKNISPNHADTFQDLIESLTVAAKNGQVQTDIRYTCPICRCDSSYSSCSLNNPEDEKFSSTETSQKCNFCSGIRKLHNTYMKEILTKRYSVNHDTIIESEFIVTDHETQSAENSGNESKQKMYHSHPQTQSVPITVVGSMEEIHDINYSPINDSKKQEGHTMSQNNCETDTGSHDVSEEGLVRKEPEPCKKTLQTDICSNQNNLEKNDHESTITLTLEEGSGQYIPIIKDSGICAEKSFVRNGEHFTPNASQYNGDSVNKGTSKVVIISEQNVTSQMTRVYNRIQNDNAVNVKLSEVTNSDGPKAEANSEVANYEHSNENKLEESPNKSRETLHAHSTRQNMQEVCKVIDNGISNVNSTKSAEQLDKEDRTNEKYGDSTPANNIENSEVNANVGRIHHSNENAKDSVIKSLLNCFEGIKTNAAAKKGSSTPTPKNKSNLLESTRKQRKSHDAVSNCVAVRRVVVKYICPIRTCGYVFVCASKLLTHIKETHSSHYKIVPENCVLLQCPFCPILLTNKKYNKHVQQHHPDKFAENVELSTQETVGSTNDDSDKLTKCNMTHNKASMNEGMIIGVDASNKQGSFIKESNELLSLQAAENKNQQVNEIFTDDKDSNHQSILREIDNASKKRTIDESDHTEVKSKKIRTVTLIVTKIESFDQNKLNGGVQCSASPTSYSQIDKKSLVCDSETSTLSSTAENESRDHNEGSAKDKDSSKMPTENVAKETRSNTNRPDINIETDNDIKQPKRTTSTIIDIKKRKTCKITLFGDQRPPVVQSKRNEEVTIDCDSSSTINSQIDNMKSSASNEISQQQEQLTTKVPNRKRIKIKKIKTRTISLYGENREPAVQNELNNDVLTEQNSDILKIPTHSLTPNDRSAVKETANGYRKTAEARKRRRVSAEQSIDSAESADIAANEGSGGSDDSPCTVKNKELVVRKLFIDKNEDPCLDNKSQLRINCKKQNKPHNEGCNSTIKNATAASDDETIHMSKQAARNRKERVHKFFGDDNEPTLSGKINEKFSDKPVREQNPKTGDKSAIPSDDEIKSSRHAIQKRKERLSKFFGDDDWSDKVYEEDVDNDVQNEKDTTSNIDEVVATASDDEVITSSKHAVQKRKERLSKLFGEDGDKEVHSEKMEKYTMHDSSNIQEDAANSDDEIIKSTNSAVIKRKKRLSKLFGDDNEVSEKDSVDQLQNVEKETDTGNINNQIKSVERKDVSNECRKDVSNIDEENKVNSLHSAENVDDRVEIDMIDGLLDEFNVPFVDQQNGASTKTINGKESSPISIDLNQVNIHVSGDDQNDSSAEKNCDINDKESSDVRENSPMEVNKDSQDTYGPEKVNSCLENIQITNITSITNKIHVFVCHDCIYGTDVYDEVIRHCQNHYNQIEDQMTYCNTCQINYDISCFDRHQDFHDSYLTETKIKFSYRWLFTNWQAVFENSSITLSEAEDMQIKSIYKTFCIKMTVIKGGLWQSALYLCAKCSTCIPPLDLENHIRQKCTFVKYPSLACGRAFLTNEMRTHHETYHANEDCNLFKTILFNDINDERFNTTLRLAKANNKQKQRHVDIFKCLCGLCFNALKKFKLHFVDCDSEEKDGTQCPRCSKERKFSETELEEHLSLHYSLFEFRVQQIAFRHESNISIPEQEESSYTGDNSTQMSDDEDLDVKTDELSAQDHVVNNRNIDYAAEETEGDIKDETASQTSNHSTPNTKRIISIKEDLDIKRNLLKDESLSQVSSEENNRNLNNIEEDITRDINEKTVFQALNAAAENIPQVMSIQEDLDIKRDMLKLESLSQVINEENSQRLNNTYEELNQNIKGKTVSPTINVTIDNATHIMSIDEDLIIKRDMLKEESLSQISTGDNSQEFPKSVENDELREDDLHDVNKESEHPITTETSQEMEAAVPDNDASQEIVEITAPDNIIYIDNSQESIIDEETEHSIIQVLHENNEVETTPKSTEISKETTPVNIIYIDNSQESIIDEETEHSIIQVLHENNEVETTPKSTEISKETRNVTESRCPIVGGQQEIAQKTLQIINVDESEGSISAASNENKKVNEPEHTATVILLKQVVPTEKPTIKESSQETSEEASQMEIDEPEELVMLDKAIAMAKESRQGTATESAKEIKKVAKCSAIIDLDENDENTTGTEKINEPEAITIEESDDDVEFVCEGKLSTLTIRTEYKR